MITIFFAKIFTFAAIGDTCKLPPERHTFFGFPHWWQYIDQGERNVFNQCIPKFNFPSDIYTIGLAVINMLLYAAGLIAVAMIIVAGISYITSGGSVENAANARRRIVTTLLGLAVILVAAAVVTFIGNSFT